METIGYDMYLERSAMTEGDLATKKQAEADFDAACKERDALDRTDEQRAEAQRKVTAAYQRMYGDDLDYYRLNIWGMSTMRGVMNALGMLVDTSAPEWPDSPDIGENVDVWEIVYALEEEDTAKLSLVAPDDIAKVKAYRAEVEKVQAWVVGDTPGIMAHKLCSNDDWLVTPAECKSAVMKWSETNDRESIVWSACMSEGGFESKQQAVEWVTRWIAWLARASEHGGFRVR